MKVGDVVVAHRWTHLDSNPLSYGIVIQLRKDKGIPPACEIMWSDGTVSGKWEDDIRCIELISVEDMELINEAW